MKPSDFQKLTNRKISEKFPNAALKGNASQSSILENNSTLAMDGRLDTCSKTLDSSLDDEKTWSVELKPNVRVKGVSITNNKLTNLNQHFQVILEGTNPHIVTQGRRKV